MLKFDKNFEVTYSWFFQKFTLRGEYFRVMEEICAGASNGLPEDVEENLIRDSDLMSLTILGKFRPGNFEKITRIAGFETNHLDFIDKYLHRSIISLRN